MGFIRLIETTSKGSRLEFRFETDLPYFRMKNFFVNYPGAVPEAPPGILNIIFAAAAMPVSWACGARVEIPILDRAYAEALPRCRDYFREWFGKRWRYGDN